MAHAVIPKTDCPHLQENFDSSAIPRTLSTSAPCSACSDTTENWLCLKCYEISCSRFVNSHGVEHFTSTGHSVGVSFSDLSVWCYSCDSYIKHPSLSDILSVVYNFKFGDPTIQDLHSLEVLNDDGKEEEEEETLESPSSEDEEDGEDGLTMEMLKKMMALYIKPLDESQEPEETILNGKVSLEGIAEAISSGRSKKIIVMTGAGISVAAGIPDFRSPGTGLYDNLQKYNLPHPTAVFELDYFRRSPEPFYLLAKELFPGNFKPTYTHHFIKMLQQKGVLLRNFTQNIDTLEREANIPGDFLVEAHGSFAESRCIECRERVSDEFIRDKILEGVVARCPKCNGLVKPDIVFFGESLPSRFFELIPEDFGECDLLIVIGTSLQVHPFASLINRVRNTTPRLLINNEVVGLCDPQMALFGQRDGFRFDMENNYRDVSFIGDCQEGILQLADLLGWKEELVAMKTLFDDEFHAKKEASKL